jgi:hypothetical protein
LVELAICIAALVKPGVLTGAPVAAAYAGFTLFVVIALRRGWPLASCGCFGRPDEKPTYLHAGLNAAAAGVAVLWTVTAPSGLWRAFTNQPWTGAPLIFISLVIAGLAYSVWNNPLERVAR